MPFLPPAETHQRLGSMFFMLLMEKKKKTSPPFLMSRFLQNWNSHPSKLLSFLLMEADPGQLFWDALRIHPAVVPVDFGEKNPSSKFLGASVFTLDHPKYFKMTIVFNSIWPFFRGHQLFLVENYPSKAEFFPQFGAALQLQALREGLP